MAGFFCDRDAKVAQLLHNVGWGRRGMAAIITIHGTNASGPEDGEKWWQRGSVFSKCLAPLIESDDGALEFTPFVWDGLNSETSRLDAGGRLLELFQQMEKQQKPYIVIGHSHGGSVIANSLLNAAMRGYTLPNLKRCVTVGTPFIESVRDFFLFSRLNLFGKAIFLVLTTFALGLTTTFIGQYSEASSLGVFLAAVVSFAVPLLLAYLLLRKLQSRHLKRYAAKYQAGAEQLFGHRMLALWHAHDEAIAGLSNVHKVRPEIFTTGFAVPFLSFAAIFIPPILLLSVAMSNGLNTAATTFLNSVIHNQELFTDRWQDRIGLAVMGIPTVMVSYFGVPREPLYEWFAAHVLATALYMCVVCVFAVLVLKIVAGISYVLSGGASRLLNAATWRQLHVLSFGSDVIGERAATVQVAPTWMHSRPAHLPARIGKKLSDFSDNAAAKSLSKFRESINELTFTEGGENRTKSVAEYLSWSELIHTSYFELDEFRRLVACEISQCDGFHPTQQFLFDPDYQQYCAWLNEIKSNSTPPMPMAVRS